MKLLFLTSGRMAPASRFRVQSIVPYLRQAGHRCVVAPSYPEKYDHLPWLGFRPSRWLRRGNRYLDLLRAWVERFDAIILERELFHDSSWDMEERFRALPSTMVLDIDDAIFLQFPQKVEALTTMVDQVLAGNAALVKWARQHNEQVGFMPTFIDTERYRPHALARGRLPPRSTLTVGWMGTSSNLEHLQSVIEPLQTIARRIPFTLHIVSDSDRPLEQVRWGGIDHRFSKWTAESELEQLAAFDLGLMPLVDSPWASYKCGAKLLQYMAMGIPSIASPVGANLDIVTHDVDGLLASDANTWVEGLSGLLQDSSQRTRLGQAAMATVESRYSLRCHLPRWIELVAAAIDRTHRCHR